MAHYKRGKCRYNGKSNRSSSTYYRKRWGLKPVKLNWRENYPDGFWKTLWPDEFNFHSNYPRYWDIQYHNRPRRAKERIVERKIITGEIDPDEAIFPLSKKPHIYYW